ncbi:MAG: 4-hydroxyphenylpyruvate dioxygenase [Chloroherpetonaceae bacterium]
MNKRILPIHDFDHVEFYVGNAKQAAFFYKQAMGFELVAYCGPETGTRDRASYVMQQGKIRFVLTSPMHSDSFIAEHLKKHGDGVRDVAFETDDAKACYELALERGATGVQEPTVLKDEYGTVVKSAVQTYGDTIHSFIERKDYKGVFLPSFAPKPHANGSTRRPMLAAIDHIVGNVNWNEMQKWVKFYHDVFDFHQFQSFDDKDISTEYTALRSIVVANESERIKMPINEPAEGKKKSQIEEYVEFYESAGVQHIAMLTDDIISTVATMRERGVEFISVPDAYYDMLSERVGAIKEDIAALKAQNILVDKDDSGYMLQIFTKPVEDRPTLFFEIIQRRGGRGFGKGNFKALFEAIERDQAARGNL